MFKVNLPVEVDVPSISGGRAKSVLMPPALLGVMIGQSDIQSFSLYTFFCRIGLDM